MLSELGPMRLAKVIPFAAVTFVLAAMASIGLPGFSGFVAEFEILIGAWRAYPTLAVLAGVGILVGIAFTWRALNRVFLGEPEVPSQTAVSLPPITWAERAGTGLLVAATVAVGVYPRVLLNLIVPAFNSPLFEGLRRGLWR